MAAPLKTMIVFGTRPEVTKLAPLALELARHPEQFTLSLVGTGQHRDLVPQHLQPFGLELDHDLKIMKRHQTLADITARTMTRMDALLADDAPDVLVVEGDTTAVAVAALAAFYRRIPVAHVEAGLRSGDAYDPFPEEMNRRLVSPLAAVHLAPTQTARENLLRENIASENIYVTGNTQIDGLMLVAKRRPNHPVVPKTWLKGRRLILVTAHRRESWDRGIREICLALGDLSEQFPDVVIIYAVHPNPVIREQAEATLAGRERVHLIDPPGYVAFVDLMKKSHLILTDSGGIQEEAPSLKKPVLVMRKTTERVEGVRAGCSRLVGTDRTRIVRETAAVLQNQKLYEQMRVQRNPYGDGKASARIRRALAYHFGLSRRRPPDFEGA